MVIPIYDVNPVRRIPLVTYGLLAANVVVFLQSPAAALLGVESLDLASLCKVEAYFHQYGAIPVELLENRQLPLVPTGEVSTGQVAACAGAAPGYEKTPVLSVLFSMFQHAGWLHLLGNMLFLMVFGNNIEDRLGSFRFLLFYVLSGYIAAYGFALSTPDTVQPMVGASGAVAGVLGAYLVLFPRARVWSLVPILLFLPLRLPAWIVLGTWFALQWVYASGLGLADGGSVAYMAHILGFVTGLLVGIAMRIAQSGKPEPDAPVIVYSKRNWR